MKLSEIAKLLSLELKGNPDEEIIGVAPFLTAAKNQITFLRDAALAKLLVNTQASAVIVRPEHAANCSVNVLISKNPQLSFAQLLEIFAYKPAITPGIHPTAIIGNNCNIDPTVSIGPYCVIKEGVSIGARTVLEAGVFIGEQTRVGEDCHFYANVNIYHQVEIHNRVLIHSGVVIGADGFGMVRGSESWHKIPQIGTVIIHDNVEIGANTTIDRGALENTVINKGVKLDNLIQVAHNVQIGEHTVIAGCTAIGGSVKIGKNCMFGGNVAIADHVTIADQVILTGRTSVATNITEAGMYGSVIPSHPMRFWAKLVARIGQLDDLFKRVKKLERIANESDQ